MNKKIKGKIWGTWVAQSVEHLDFRSGHDLMFYEFEPYTGLFTVSAEPALDPVSPSLSLFLSATCALSLSLSKINKHQKNKKEKKKRQNQTYKYREQTDGCQRRGSGEVMGKMGEEE